ncbi:hypothetical protein EVAR_102199_1 [Eumeta japonica]|uniref:Uncharacterized protein n=1 Tax=Eumeta variegata TaxID=151549 RepID=A0A4C1WCY8_EUMVA|nr:hypothetical protein EVAR_102199_1 [Eumeta japonica]
MLTMRSHRLGQLKWAPGERRAGPPRTSGRTKRRPRDPENCPGNGIKYEYGIMRAACRAYVSSNIFQKAPSRWDSVRAGGETTGTDSEAHCHNRCLHFFFYLLQIEAPGTWFSSSRNLEAVESPCKRIGDICNYNLRNRRLNMAPDVRKKSSNSILKTYGGKQQKYFEKSPAYIVEAGFGQYAPWRANHAGSRRARTARVT